MANYSVNVLDDLVKLAEKGRNGKPAEGAKVVDSWKPAENVHIEMLQAASGRWVVRVNGAFVVTPKGSPKTWKTYWSALVVAVRHQNRMTGEKSHAQKNRQRSKRGMR